MKVRIVITTLSALAFASCTSESYLGTTESTPTKVEEDVAIDFGGITKAMTRVSHEESAALLGNSFLVYGTKTKDNVTSPIFDNYTVNYTDGSAGTSTTNIYGWEYVGNVSKKGAIQGIKYWDFSAQRFDFVAAAGLAADELINSTSEGMRVHVSDAVAMTNLYVANRVTATPVAQAATATTPVTEAYKNTIQFQFRRLGAQMRIGFYETVPGYAIKNLVFYYIGAPSGSYEVGVGGAFPSSGTYSVTYDDATNAAKVKFVGSSNKYAFANTFGHLDYTSAYAQAGVVEKPYIDTEGKASATPVNAFLGISSSQATFGKGYYTIDGTSGVASAYKPILPSEDNTLKMQLRVDYTLIALDGSRDSIHVRDAYVAVPANFLRWKPNYSYTYIFKISDNSNGYTGNGGGGTVTTGPGRDPDPDNGGGDNNPVIDPVTGEEIPPYIPDPNYPEIPDPDNPGATIPDPAAPLIPNPAYPAGPEGDQHDPSNPVPTPSIPDPDNPGGTIPDPLNPASLFPITFDAVVVDEEEGGSSTVITDVE